MKKFTKILTLALLSLSFASCLKDKAYDDFKTGINQEAAESYKVINIPSTNTSLAVSGTYPLVVNDGSDGNPITYRPATTPVTLTVPVHLSAKDVASEELNVTLAVDQDDAKINAYNATVAAASRYTRMPADKYTLSNGGVAKIPAGSRDGSITVTFTPSTLTPGGRYIIPVSITNVDKSGYTISGNQGYRLILAVIRR
ncbi:DUF1735 domain-containing protein [Mucilaginibacter sp. Bleaf8]|uniref:DUF1735 domain-containing protein n=1 Tax=Mucilaginibacter sp. Bleaf8 TaxID=2834430 RepID=UPI001BD179C0|nr:DUF1735 domain-containing protein [Mucilaginibacter sp. Bleaf8]MBS7564372.1 DUF1735 domain-containing protein [Mucilaginibacter sp. Bleaf8]